MGRVFLLVHSSWNSILDPLAPAIEKILNSISKDEIAPSLERIFAELVSDLGVGLPKNGDLSPWRERGVLLLNRVLTTRVGQSNAHTNLGWQEITTQIAHAAATQGAIGVLWGRNAQELSHHFTHSIESVHPSPLSAYRGFFGSKPFARVNQELERRGISPINWAL